MTVIALIREWKTPPDRRVALTPEQCAQIQAQYPDVRIVVQTSLIRCFSDEEYSAKGIEIKEDVSDADIFLGVKEVPVQKLIPHKTYLFFSHTIKKQQHNRKLLQAVLAQNIRLIDYETLTNEQGERVIAFGRYAGLVGAYNAFRTWGERYKTFTLKPANACFDLEEMWSECAKIKLPAIKIALTGSGRVGGGALETLQKARILQVSPADFLSKQYNEPVFAQLNSKDYHKHKNGESFDRIEFHQSPENFSSTFMDYAKVSDMLIAAAFWHPRAPMLFTKPDMRSSDFKIKVIADITCDIDGSIPSTLAASSIAEPFYDYCPHHESMVLPFSKDTHITVMAIDNLPCELPRNASNDFGKQLVNNVLPALLLSKLNPTDGMIKRATIAEDGLLTKDYSYLQDYVNA
ncbi:MAG: alanine dehydrogenase [Cytophagales bacterium]|nr:MAG: alanine dehydrogenase [Cytophagales bacterium]TAF61098.1 MAG: alanine dehydrogenase [Cytophagales bacterium]